MNTAVNGSSSMGPETTMASGNGYNDAWVTISPYSQSPYGNSPMTEYPNFGGYMPHGVPSEPINRMALPPQQQQPQQQPQQHQHQHQQQHQHQHQQQQQRQQQQPNHQSQQHHQLIQPAPPPVGHQQLPMLNTTWPSQLTNPAPVSGSSSAPPLSSTQQSTPSLEASQLPPQQEKPRKTLSAEQKRAMCQYHEDNPGTRQADIGARFGVERSTVSKVLRHKDQYLKRDQEPESAALKRAKAKHPDFDRTLSNYVRRQQQSGFDITDEDIMEQARLFAHAGGGQDGLLSSLTSNWLQKFKQKHGIGAGRLMRRASEANIPDSARLSTSLIDVQKDRGRAALAPGSPRHQISPLSGSRSDEDLRADGFNFSFSYRQNASQSTTSLTSDVRDNSHSSFSAGPLSPTASFNFSPETNNGPFPMVPNVQIRNEQLNDANDAREKRSHAFPTIDTSYGGQAVMMQPVPAMQPSTTTASPALPSPANEIHSAPPFSMGRTLTSPPTLRRSGSNPSIVARSNTTPTTSTVVPSGSLDSSPVSPTPEDARRAANTLLNYIQNMSSNGQFDQNEYLAIVQLTKKLQIHQQQVGRLGIGGLSRIPEGDGEATGAVLTAMETR